MLKIKEWLKNKKEPQFVISIQKDGPDAIPLALYLKKCRKSVDIGQLYGMTHNGRLSHNKILFYDPHIDNIHLTFEIVDTTGYTVNRGVMQANDINYSEFSGFYLNN